MDNNAFIYTRYSSSSQDEQTIEVQLKECRKYANSHGISVLGEYIDEAKTGRNDKRPDYQKMLRDIENENISFVIVYKIDRVARNASLGLGFEKELKKKGIIVLSTQEPYSDDANGKLMRGMNYLIAEYYSNDYAQRISKGLENNASKFLSIGISSSPFGFKTENKKIVINEKEAPYVLQIFKMYSQGKRIVEITNYLNDLGVKTKTGGNFNKNSLSKMLRNKRYIGTYIYKGKESPNTIPRIIEDDLFYKVQERLNKNKKFPARIRAKNEYLLTGKLFCGYCGEMLIGFSGTSKNKNLKTYYKCKSAIKHKCDKKAIQKRYLEDLILMEARKILNNKVITEIAKKVITLVEKDRDTEQLKILNKAKKNNEKQTRNLIDAIAECGDVSLRKQFYERVKELENQKLLIEKELLLEERKHTKLTLTQIKYFLSRIKEGKQDDITYNKMLINSFVNKIYLYDDYVKLVLNVSDTPVDIDLNVINKAKSSFIESSSPPN